MVSRFALFRLLGAVLVLGLVAFSPAARAQLYAREAPPGSTFVHVFNATAATGVPVQVGDKGLPALLPYSATSFMFLPPGEHSVQAGGRKQSFLLEGNHYYTVVSSADGLKLYEAHEPLTKLKALIGLYNLMPGTTLALKTGDGATPVFESVAPSSSAQRTINPLKVQ